MTRTLAALMLFAGTAALAADPPAATDAKALDKTIVASLRDIHDRGADLYNQSKDYPAAYRLYEGSLLTVKPLLAHRPDVQKTIEDRLAAAGKDPDPARKAFLLHEAIEKVRAELKGAAPSPKPPTDVKPKDPKETTPKPKEAVPKPKEPKAAVTVAGKVTVLGKPLAEGTVTFVSLDQKAPKVASGMVKDGSYSVKDLPAGKYAVAVTSDKAGAVPAKFATTDTSGLTFQVQAGANQFDIELK